MSSKAKKSKTPVDDLLGPSPDDLLGPKKRTRKYAPLTEPKTPVEGGIFELKAKAGKTLGKKCLICKKDLKHTSGRPPLLCGKKDCFRSYRNAYRAEYDKVRRSAA